MGNRTCAVHDCEKRVRSRGWCDRHYWRWRKYGSPTEVTIIYGDVEARFWPKVNKDGPTPAHRLDLGPCWLWTASLFPGGYGCFSLDQKSVLAHRWAFERLVSSIPEDLTLDHLCREKRCVNPGHLEPVTAAENIRRAHAAKTHCAQGHPFDETNTYRHGGRRYCRSCRKNRKRRRAA